jgi:hypothetical protein
MPHAADWIEDNADRLQRGKKNLTQEQIEENYKWLQQELLRNPSKYHSHSERGIIPGRTQAEGGMLPPQGFIQRQLHMSDPGSVPDYEQQQFPQAPDDLNYEDY